jgi:hypothetical protein
MSEIKAGDTVKRVIVNSQWISVGDVDVVKEVIGGFIVLMRHRNQSKNDASFYVGYFEKVPSEPTTKEEAIKLMQECKAKMEKLEAYINEADEAKGDVWTEDDVYNIETSNIYTQDGAPILMCCDIRGGVNKYAMMNKQFIIGSSRGGWMEDEEMAEYLNANGYKKHE